jgi:hypothetical protein
MTTTTVLRARPRDVIAHAWYHLGYRPTNSLVLVAVRGPRLKLGVVMRVDLPPPTQSRELVHHVAQQIASGLRRAGASATVALVMSARALKSPPRRLIRSLCEVLAQRRIEMIDVIGVTPRVFRSLICRAQGCCPRGGEPVTSVLTSNVSLAHIVSGDTLADLAPRAGPPPDATTLAATDLEMAALQAVAAKPPADPESPPANPATGLAPEQRERWWRIWTAALQTGDLPPANRSGFALALADEILRDAVLVTSMGAPTEAMEPPSAALGGVPTSLANVPGWQLWLEVPPPEDRTRLIHAVRALSAAAREGLAGHRADTLAVLGVVAWYADRGDRARQLVERALRERPDHSLALTVLGLVSLGASPPWRATGEDDPAASPVPGSPPPRLVTTGPAGREWPGDAAPARQPLRSPEVTSLTPGPDVEMRCPDP